ncbi:UNKNOWN [Stylonychia lemnae]|uniref:Uncharacterized protein n=1 Tax=Stylonychia lemnae TaxID=5949 RepID=A0A078AJC5_STYLE|nr:UNKNOWN [Stylonychia lemnae]|eukprot:CDW82430.1 UNKNOWN [Stylonychia lemnae]
MNSNTNKNYGRGSNRKQNNNQNNRRYKAYREKNYDEIGKQQYPNGDQSFISNIEGNSSQSQIYNQDQSFQGLDIMRNNSSKQDNDNEATIFTRDDLSNTGIRQSSFQEESKTYNFSFTPTKDQTRETRQTQNTRSKVYSYGRGQNQRNKNLNEDQHFQEMRNNRNQRAGVNDNHQTSTQNNSSIQTEGGTHDNRNRRIQRDNRNNERPRFYSTNTLKELIQFETQALVQKLISFGDLNQKINGTFYTREAFSFFVKILFRLLTDENVLSTELNLIFSHFLDSKFMNTIEEEYLRDMSKIKNQLEYYYMLVDLEYVLKDLAQKLVLRRFRLKEEEKTSDLNRQILNEDTIDNSVTDYQDQPPDDFQNINVSPTEAEIKADSDPFLRPMPEKGQFKDRHDYLDIVYRLLREDAIRPLRRGSKRLLPGSLVILSSDEFQTLSFFLVQAGNQDRMVRTTRQSRYVQINIMMLAKVNENIGQQATLLEYFIHHRKLKLKMLESQAYFESYRHVLKKIKEIDRWEKIPFDKYFVGLERTVIDRPPMYQLFEQSNILQNVQQFINLEISTKNFDESQLNAIKACLYQELAIIQGPPGTGKTYVGQIFVSILLKIKEKFNVKNGPILLVCYTNHALDQFLDLVSGFTGNFVRIGGNIKNEKFKNHTFTQYQKKIGARYYSRFYSILSEIDQQQIYIQDRNSIFLMNDLGIINNNTKVMMAKTLLLKIQQDFKFYLKDQIENIFSNQANQDFGNYAYQYIFGLVEEETDLPVVFWLGIIDLEKFLRDILLSLQTGELNIQDLELFDVNFDDFEQRERDYEESLFDDDNYSIRRQIKSELKTKYENLTMHYHRLYQNEYYQGLSNFFQCTQRG